MSMDEKTLYVHMTAPSIRSVILGVVVSTFIVFNWGYAAWMFFGIHDSSVRAIPNELAIASALKNADMKTGYYVYPALETMRNRFGENEAKLSDEELKKQFEERHEAGPIFSIAYKADGDKPMQGSMLGGGFVIQLLASSIVGFMLYMTAGTAVHYWQRVLVVVLMAIFGLLISHVALWNWMYYPLDYTLAMVFDPLIGWMLAGLAMAAIIKPRVLREGTEPVR